MVCYKSYTIAVRSRPQNEPSAVLQLKLFYSSAAKSYLHGLLSFSHFEGNSEQLLEEHDFVPTKVTAVYRMMKIEPYVRAWVPRERELIPTFWLQARTHARTHARPRVRV